MATHKTVKRIWFRFWYKWGIVYCGYIDSRWLTLHRQFCGFTIFGRSYIIIPLNRLAKWRHAKVIARWGYAKVR